MVRLLIRTLLGILANLAGLVIASWLVDGFELKVSGIVTALIIFSGANILLGPLITKIAIRDVPALIGGIALVTTFVSLILTDAFSKGLSINKLSAWVIGTLIVWLASLAASLLLPIVLFKKALGNTEEDKK
jgi:putative membrane protein